MQGAKDPDEFLKKYGADRFRLLLEQSENQAEYRLDSLKRKYDLTQDEQRVEFLREAAVLVASFPNAVMREIYGTRAASEAAGVTPEAMKVEVSKAYRKRLAQEKRAQEKIDLSPAAAAAAEAALGIRYDNVKSAMAEEGLLRMVLKEPSLLSRPERPLPEQFSAPSAAQGIRGRCWRRERTASDGIAAGARGRADRGGDDPYDCSGAKSGRRRYPRKHFRDYLPDHPRGISAHAPVRNRTICWRYGIA
jgi:DNA primase